MNEVREYSNGVMKQREFHKWFDVCFFGENYRETAMIPNRENDN